MINSFSPNMLKTYKTCPKKFFYQYIEKVSVPVSQKTFDKGKKIHALANYFLQGINISRIETALSEEELYIWHLLLDNPFYKKDCLKSEFPVMSKFGNYWVGGRLDAIVYDIEKYYILDYKTGSIPKNPEFDYQTMIYLLCVDSFLKNYESLSFVYINLRNKQNYVIEFNEELRCKYEQKILDICNMISSDGLYLPNNESCKYCEFFKICEFHQ